MEVAPRELTEHGETIRELPIPAIMSASHMQSAVPEIWKQDHCHHLTWKEQPRGASTWQHALCALADGKTLSALNRSRL